VTARQALWVHGDSGVPSYGAVDDRSFLAAVLAGDMFDSVTAGLGARGRGHGVLDGGAFAVGVTGTNNGSVRVGPGLAAIRGSASGQLGCYVVANDANDDTVTLTNRPTVTNSRRDLIIARLRDNAYGISGNDWILDKLTGTAAVSPTDPVVPAGSSILVLARVTIPPGANPFTVQSGWITDLRPHARAVGGITPVASVASYPDPQDFDVAWETSTSYLKMRLGGTWVTIGQDLDTLWTSVTPNWAGSFTVGNGTHYLRYMRFGRTISGVAGFERGTTSTQTGQLMLSLTASGLPAVATIGGAGRYMAGGRMYDASAATFWSVAADIDPADSRIKNFATGGNAIWSATAPVTWATGDHFRIFFNYEAA
jgi:hypothetical protein